MTRKKIPTPLYCRLKYAEAPRLTASEICSISGVPGDSFRTRANMAPAKINAMRDPIATKTMVSIKIHASSKCFLRPPL